MNYEQACEKLQKSGQLHVFKYYEELTQEEKEALLSQVENLDFTMTASCGHREELIQKGKITPLAAMQLPEINERKEEFRTAGLKAIKEGKVGAVLLAGGMGTRLGSDAPKGVYNIGLTKEVFIFN